ncbi:hypothetical protein HXX76_005482 [Chlamydomonas incerta]|uniref:F-box domain-containing protein n=1 Tax=Chlamydomonas incerta TaxID=51695 RepID=A0A835W5H2_CHLIN|nr:hypothetical protein HXX76_005482 [Chlamydomonas incerta]|eukprot:KAG2437864.1 hypothetical protein HXX76_005482 [Chlamydomonas incerta]
MKTFTKRKRSGSSSSSGALSPAEAPLCGRGTLPPRASSWESLPDGVLELISFALLPDADRLRCALVCRGWRHAFRCAVAGVSANLEAMPRAAQRQLATLDAAFPAATKCRLVFPKFLLPPPDPHGLGVRHCYRAPLLGSPQAVPDPDGASGQAYDCERGGAGHGRGSSAAGAAAGTLAAGHGADVGRLRAVAELELDLGLAGYTALVLHRFFNLPALQGLTVRGFSPAAENAAAAALAAAAPPAAGAAEEGGAAAGGERQGQGQGLAPLPALTLRGFAQLQALTLSGTLSYRDIFDVPRVTSLRSLKLEGRAAVGRTEGYIYLAALRRLSSLCRLQHLALLGPVYTCAAAGHGAAGGGHPAGPEDPEQLGLAPPPVHPRHDGAAAVGGLVASLTCLTCLQLATLAPVLVRGEYEEEGAAEGGEQVAWAGGAAAPHLVPCDWARLPLEGFTGLQELSLKQPGHLPSSFWTEPAALRQHGDGAGGCGRLRALSLDVGSSGIVDELPRGALEGMTRLHLSGVQLDALTVLTAGAAARGCRGCLADLVLELPAEGYCDTGRRHNVDTLAALGALTRLELRTAAPKGGATGGAGGGCGAAGSMGAGTGGEGRGGGGGGASTDRLLLNDSRLQALTRGLRRLASLSFRGSLPLGDDGVRCLGRSLTGLTRLELVNDGGAPATVGLHLLPQGLQELSLYCVGLGLPPPAAEHPAAVPATGGGLLAAVAAPTALPQQQVLPCCRVLHLDYCSGGAPVWRVLGAMLGTAAAAAGSSNGGHGNGTGNTGTSRRSGSPAAAASFRAGGGLGVGCGGGAASAVLEELRLQVSNASGLSVSDAAAVASLPRLRKLQVSCGAGALPDFTLTRMLTPDAGSAAQLACLSLRLPGCRLSLGQLQALRRLGGLRSLYLDVLPPTEVALMEGELRHLTGLRALTLGPVYGRGCSLQPQVLPALGRLQAVLRTCRLQQAAAG